MRALIVDDRYENCYLLQVLLRAKGFDTVEAVNGQEALELARAEPPDLVISDLLMPVMDGYSLLREWKQDQRLQHIPFIVYTATYTEEKDRLLALELGADEFLIKPMEPEPFMEQVHAVLTKARQGELQVNPPTANEQASLKLYNEVLIGKLEKKSAELEQRVAELTLSNRALEACANGILILDKRDGHTAIQYANPAFERITGHSREAVLGSDPTFLLGVERQQLGMAELKAAVRELRESQVVLRNYRSDGSLFWNELTLAPVLDAQGQASHFVVIIDDITERKRYEEELERQSNWDAITGLANRNLLKDRIERAIAAAQEQPCSVALLLLNGDQYKRVNDILGHKAGDALLRHVADCLRGLVGPRETLARLSNDEFVVVLPQVHDAMDASHRAQRIIERLHGKPFQIDEHVIQINASIGISLYPDDAATVENLLRNADAAMHQAKEAGRKSFCFFTADMNHEAKRKLELESRLQHAVQRNELVLLYQPLIDQTSGRITGAEALLRWCPEPGKMVSPLDFIPLAEETGLILPIGEWVLCEACHQAARWQRAGFEVCMSVNLSARQFSDRNLATVVKQCLSESGLAAGLLKLEITETAMMDNPEQATRIVQELKSLGVSVAIDDFGTGYSSLSYLRHFPFDQLKIDRSFVADIAEHPESAVIVSGIIRLANSLRLQTVAEGVETEQQWRILRDAGCDLLQGFLFSRPVPADELVALLDREYRVSGVGGSN